MFKDKTLRALGAMSGTSLDGVDAAVLLTDGHQILGMEDSAFRPYSPDEQAVLRDALGQWGGPKVEAAAEVVDTAHAQLLIGFGPVDLVGFHGQTLAHDPQSGRTHQTGDGQVLAEILQLPVVWDFRSADMRMGGQGAPLAPFYHFALAKWLGATEPLAFLNLGGVGNLTWVDPRHAQPELPGALLAFDTGPANAPINDFLYHRRGEGCDLGGALAGQGNVDDKIIKSLMRDRYFSRMPPKSLDRDSFADLVLQVADLDDADGAATLTAAAAMSVATSLQHCPEPPQTLLVGGGGRRNKTLMAMLQAGIDAKVKPIDDVGLDGDMLEAQAFAYLAVRVAKGLPTSCPGTTGVRAAVSGGTISKPRASLA